MTPSPEKSVVRWSLAYDGPANDRYARHVEDANGGWVAWPHVEAILAEQHRLEAENRSLREESPGTVEPSKKKKRAHRMTSALTKLSPHCPFCLVEAKIGDEGFVRSLQREDFASAPESATEPREIHCWNCGKDYTARFYEPQG